MRSNRARGAEATTGLAATTQGPARRWATSAGRTVLPCPATHHPRGGECVGETRCRLAAYSACAVLVPGLGGWATAPPQNCHAHCRHAVLAAGAQRRRQAARRACQKLSRHYDHGEELWQALRHARVAVVAGVHPAHCRRRVRLHLCTWVVGPWGGLLVVAGWWGRRGGRHVGLPSLTGPYAVVLIRQAICGTPSCQRATRMSHTSRGPATSVGTVARRGEASLRSLATAGKRCAVVAAAVGRK